MAVLETNRLSELLEGRTQEDWSRALDELAPSMHEVDRDAVRIWFAFWPLELHLALSGAEEPERIVRAMDLEGNWRLSEQIDASVGFLYGARFWPSVKQALLEDDQAHESLAQAVRVLAGWVASAEKVDPSLTLGITAVGMMTLRQVGTEALQAAVASPASGPLLAGDPNRIVSERRRESRDGLFTFLKGVNRRWNVRWDERQPGAVFKAINTQDLAMAGASADGDYRELDYRRIDGPLPVECRVGSCGYCWVGVLGGREKLSPVSPFERERLAYFGYDTSNGDAETHPLVRLACQAQCQGDVTLAVAPWNGELSRRHDTARDELGTA